MSPQYQSFMDDIWSKFPVLYETELTDITDHNLLWTLTDYINAGYVSFKTGRKELLRLSILLENYAAKNNAPLLATFETDKRYKYVEEHYFEILQKIPKAWIIGDFKNENLAPQPPNSAKVISCDGTNIADMWIVITKGEKGPFGLVAESIGDGLYRGFFSISPTVIGAALENISRSLKVPIDFS